MVDVNRVGRLKDGPSSLLRPEPGERIRTPPIRGADEATSRGSRDGGKGLREAGADAQVWGGARFAKE